MKVGDIIRLDIGNKIRVWEVVGIYLGSARQEDLVGLKSLDLHPGTNGPDVVDEMLVPREMVEAVSKIGITDVQ